MHIYIYIYIITNIIQKITYFRINYNHLSLKKTLKQKKRTSPHG